MAEDGFWDKYELVKEIPVGKRGDVVRVAVAKKGSKEGVDVRNYYEDRGGDLQPGKGIFIGWEVAGEVAGAIEEAVSGGAP